MQTVLLCQVKVYNMDGEEFINSVIKSDLLERWHDTSQTTGDIHVVMNLPSLAVDFLKFFRGLLYDGKTQTEPCASLMPVIHCYSFSRADDPVTDAAERIAAVLGVGSFEDFQDRDVRVVRNVAPGKEMLCVTFRLPWHVLATGEHGTSVCTELILLLLDPSHLRALQIRRHNEPIAMAGLLHRLVCKLQSLGSATGVSLLKFCVRC